MPFYRFIMHGDGNLVNGIKGFYTTRWCWASDQQNATSKALRIVRQDIERQRLGTITSLEIEEGWRITPFDIRKAPNRGYTFYIAEDEPDEQRVEDRE